VAYIHQVSSHRSGVLKIRISLNRTLQEKFDLRPADLLEKKRPLAIDIGWAQEHMYMLQCMENKARSVFTNYNLVGIILRFATNGDDLPRLLLVNKTCAAVFQR